MKNLSPKLLFSLLIITFQLNALAQPFSCPAVDIMMSDAQRQCIAQTQTVGKINLLASRSVVRGPNEFLLDGDICIIQDDMRMMAPKLYYHKTKQLFDSEGEVLLQNANQRIIAGKAQFNSTDMSAQLETVDFFLMGSDMNGQAQHMRLNDNQSQVDYITFSTCSQQQRDWEIVAKSAALDHQQGVGTFKGVSLRFKDVPIFYVPWAKLPLNDDRRTGLLIPGFSYSDNTGLDLSLPYYINIAPQVDATLTPRFLQQHGLMLGAEFRYLS